MRYSLLLITLLSTHYFTQTVYASEAQTANWSATAYVGFVSDYYFRGITQTWHKPAMQGGFDIAHNSGFYAGVWGSNITSNTYPDANAEIDVYAGYNGNTTIDGLSWTAGLYGYLYPGGSWRKYDGLTADQGKPSGESWDTYEVNAGLSYRWISTKLSYTLSNWFGAEKQTGWTNNTKGSTYIEINTAYPLSVAGLTLVGHVGHLNVNGELQSTGFPNANGIPGTYKTNPDYTDYKIGLSKAFSIGKSEGWNAGMYYVSANDTGYWSNGYGSTSFSRTINGSTETKNMSDGRFVLALTRTF